jgi:hypothetical protein
MSDQPEWIYELIQSQETENIHYGYCVPLKDGGFAWLLGMNQDIHIEKTDDGIWYYEGFPKTVDGKNMEKYLNEIKSGKGNWIISPQNDNSDLKWSDLDYANASVVKRMTKVTKEYNYEVD